MICPECFYDKWDGKSSHQYGGRESAGMQCYGPKRRIYAPAVEVNRPIPPTRPALDPVDPTLASERVIVPDKPTRPAVDAPPKAPKMNKAQRALQELAAKFGLKPASQIAPPVETVRTSEERSSGRSRQTSRRVSPSAPRNGRRGSKR